ncbi:autotransporter outer membrane beta-barrel domain-containing protein [Alginatibacterium sediminis]|nr:autotransporter outer membrane beta-barrel domain-containing protein [Alginatibacterium sediminis]
MRLVWRLVLVAIISLCISAISASASASDKASASDTRLNDAVNQRLVGALALFGFAAVPSETASAIFLDTGQEDTTGTDFKAGQIGGGFTWSEQFPLYLEGFVGWNRYDPVFLFSNGDEQRKTEAKWTSFALSGAVGWDFEIYDNIVLRPMGLVALGIVTSDVIIGLNYLQRQFDDDLGFLDSGQLSAGGLGGSLALVYNERWLNDWEADVILRHTRLYVQPIAGDKDISGQAKAYTTSLWSRLRVPTGFTAFQRPIRTVAEFSAGYYDGDQQRIFSKPWLFQVGLGGEIDVSKTKIPWVTTARAMLRYTQGDRVEGFSFGLAVSF